MRYVMFMIPAAYSEAKADLMPDVEMVEKMMAYNAQLAEGGVLESLNGLHPPSAGIRLTFTENGPEVDSSPPVGAIGGYWIINTDSHEAAVEWARRCPALPGDVIELRRIQEIEEFPQDVQDVVNNYDI